MWDVHQLHFFPVLKKTLVLGERTQEQGQWYLDGNRNVHTAGLFSHTGHSVYWHHHASIGFLLGQIPLKVPRWLHVNSHIFTVKSVSSEAARALVLGKGHFFVLLTHCPTVHRFQHLHVAAVLPLSSFFVTNQKIRGFKTGLFFPYDLKKHIPVTFHPLGKLKKKIFVLFPLWASERVSGDFDMKMHFVQLVRYSPKQKQGQKWTSWSITTPGSSLPEFAMLTESKFCVSQVSWLTA